MRSPILVCLAVLLCCSNLHGDPLFPAVSLPKRAPRQPSMVWKKGQLSQLRRRRTDEQTRPLYQKIRRTVDRQLGRLAGRRKLGDDQASKLARGAALLQLLGDRPGKQFSSYRDVAVAALLRVGRRSPRTGLAQPRDLINVLQDSSRLQSMAEAYDMLRGSGLRAADDRRIRGTLAGWAEALRRDLNLTGAFGIPGHRDNWGIKAGAALVSTALAMPDHEGAAAWLAFGQQLINQSFARVGSRAGWYREGPHYLNYALNNLITAAWHVRNATGVDWFAPLEPYARLSLLMRQPDGWQHPFEEGVPVVFPYDVLAGRFDRLGPALQWAWENSSKQTGSYDNQSLQEVTRLLMVAPGLRARPPERAPTCFVGADAFVVVLRSGWQAGALQATMIAALDHKARVMTTSRHNMANPLDVAIHGGGRLLVPTSGGGPQVTRSKRRRYYLSPSARNVPLVEEGAPFLHDPKKVRIAARLDGRFLDAATIRIEGYREATVTRLLAMVDDRYLLVGDRFEAQESKQFGVPWRGRGKRSIEGSRVRWTYRAVPLQIDLLGSRPGSPVAVAGWYAAAWNTEEPIQGVRLDQTGERARVLSVIQVGRAAEVGRLAGGLGARVGEDRVLFGPGKAGELACDGELAVVRTDSRGAVSFGLVGGRKLQLGERVLLAASRPVTVSATRRAGGLTLWISPDVAGVVDYRLSWPGTGPVTARFSGRVVPTRRVPGGLLVPGLSGGGQLRLSGR